MTHLETVLIDDVPLTMIYPQVQPDGPATAGVVVIQEAFGVTEHIVDIGRRLAAAGYLAAIPHLYHRLDAQVFEGSDFAQAGPAMSSLTGAGMAHDVAAAIHELSTQVPMVGIIGFCMGGSVALWAAGTQPVQAAVDFYGGGVAQSRWTGVPSGLESAAQVVIPVLGLFGDLDSSIPIEQVELLREQLSQQPAPSRVIRFADAGHAFNNDTREDHFHRESAARAWQETLQWFGTHLV